MQLKTAGQVNFESFVGYSVDEDLGDANLYNYMFRGGFNFVQFGSLEESFDFIQDLRKKDPKNPSLLLRMDGNMRT